MWTHPVSGVCSITCPIQDSCLYMSWRWLHWLLKLELTRSRPQTWHPPQTDWCGFCCGETPSSAIVNLYTSGNMRLWKKMLYLWTDRQRSEHWAYILISASFGRKCNQWWKATFWMFEFCIRVIPDWVQSVQLYSCTLGSCRKREVFNCSASNGQFWAWSSVQSKWQVTTPSTSLPYLWLLSFTGHKGLSLMSEICDCNKSP